MEAANARGTLQRDRRIATLDCLRGLAASAVVWFHLTNGNPAVQLPDWLRASGRHGWMGVEIFFVISGFVIPHALQTAGFRLKDYGPFLLRRIVRLEPPYLASIALTMALAFASTAITGFRGAPLSYSPLQIASHLAYLTGFLGLPWINVVYWSLSLELQYYLLIGLLFPLVAHRHAAVRLLAVAGLCAAAWAVPNDLFVFRWLWLFVPGILAFHLRHGMLSRTAYLAAVALVAAGVAATSGRGIALIALSTTMMIAFADIEQRLLLFLGSISYSLYLVHVPTGGRVMNAATRVELGPFSATLVALGAFLVSVAAAYAFHAAVERPARKWAAGIKYGRQNRPAAPACAANPVLP